ncbi:hypothetical protein FRX31_028497 [Thalictrum thalictroides]|uniref:Uncharacterized protein n=1 Tax=Thalictrum thalictroides TaxID=46969 RepID=A0A7J6VAU3_THATH|nr:hypothetical protein FRX31_028497 [Thalictrum thalictroides]
MVEIMKPYGQAHRHCLLVVDFGVALCKFLKLRRVASTGGWDQGKGSEIWLGETTLQQQYPFDIQYISGRDWNKEDREDLWNWSLNNGGNFTVKSLYDKLVDLKRGNSQASEFSVKLGKASSSRMRFLDIVEDEEHKDL